MVQILQFQGDVLHGRDGQIDSSHSPCIDDCFGKEDEDHTFLFKPKGAQEEGNGSFDEPGKV